jgi:uncharacterized membrane protein
LRQIPGLTLEWHPATICLESKESRVANKAGAGIAIGAGIGAAIGVTIDNIGVGVAIGIATGAAVGAALQNKKKQD